MKKIAAILLICLLAFNWFGYKFFINYLQKKADRNLEARLDVNDYDESQLIEIRVALNMPYQNDQANFERHYGEIEMGGKIYTYVKSKIEDGYLVLKCIANTAKQNIKNADNILFNANNGLDQEHNGKGNSPLNNIAKTVFGSDYDDHFFRFASGILNEAGKNWLRAKNSLLYNITLPVSEQPPEALLS